MTKWANPTSRRRFHPAWYSILIGIGIVGLLVLTCEGCAAKVVDLSGAVAELQAKNAALLQKNESLSNATRTTAGDNARVTNISLTSVGGYGWGGLATLAGFAVWRQKRTRETAALRIIEAIEHAGNVPANGDTVKRIKGMVILPLNKEDKGGLPDAAERWIKKQVKRL